MTKTVYGGAKIIYDDKARSLEMIKYGVFVKAEKNFLVGLEYSQTGDKCSIDCSLNHKVDLSTQVGSVISYDCSQHKVSSTTVVERKLSPDGTTIKAKIDN